MSNLEIIVAGRPSPISQSRFFVLDKPGALCIFCPIHHVIGPHQIWKKLKQAKRVQFGRQEMFLIKRWSAV